VQEIADMYDSVEDLRKLEFRLHAVMVHEGSIDSGHYWAYVRDHKKKVRLWPQPDQGGQGSMFLSQFSAIFANFRRKKLAFFSKTNVMIKILHYLALF
jgi:hypothetical protein